MFHPSTRSPGRVRAWLSPVQIRTDHHADELDQLAPGRVLLASRSSERPRSVLPDRGKCPVQCLCLGGMAMEKTLDRGFRKRRPWSVRSKGGEHGAHGAWCLV